MCKGPLHHLRLPDAHLERLSRAPRAVVLHQAADVGKSIRRHRGHDSYKGLEKGLHVIGTESTETAMLKDKAVAGAVF